VALDANGSWGNLNGTAVNYGVTRAGGGVERIERPPNSDRQSVKFDRVATTRPNEGCVGGSSAHRLAQPVCTAHSGVFAETDQNISKTLLGPRNLLAGYANYEAVGGTSRKLYRRMRAQLLELRRVSK